MSKDDPGYFRKFKFSHEQIIRYMDNALRDLKIAHDVAVPEVRFTYGYQALIKAGIVLLAKTDHVRVRSVPGHHIKILTRMNEILKDPDVLTIGNVMRMKRNTDFYGGGEDITEKEAQDYLRFIKKTVEAIQKRLI